ncbi:hypothetical protein LUX29_21315 [Aureimonas altamirensis]|uniref:D-apionate lactonase n=1 Tax=Aureimonas altamirensis TaxID=370622 RepID=UPI001E45E6CB|nr:hypothetical protein [Aureimonas altamirensis]UHD45495.1 hypothetical protein LUX29_21315 [Aureimonas altamirensis]
MTTRDDMALRGPAAEGRRLLAGRLSAELVSGGLRDIRYDGHEVLRAIDYVVRDRDWGTYDLTVTGLDVDETQAGFSIRYAARCTAPDGTALHLSARIEGSEIGTLSFTVDATPDGAFETNRTGFCVLHPIEGVAGAPVRVTHTDGATQDAHFPDLIEPWQPFKDIRALDHSPAPGLSASCRMEGDTFEMEDQRAWSDASYKTYVRPLSLPWPYRLAPDMPLRQSVTLTVRRSAGAAPKSRPDVVSIRLGERLPTHMPPIGVAVSPGEIGDVHAARDALAELNPQSLLLTYEPGIGHGPAELEQLRMLAEAVPDAERVLEFVVPTAGPLESTFDMAASAVLESGLAPHAVAALADVDRQSTPPGSEWPACPPLEDIYTEARRAFPGVLIGGGMFSYFTELNRKRVPAALLDFVTHATCPIVHAADDRSVMQTLEAIPYITRSTSSFIGTTAYRLGPTTIGMRQNPYGSRTMPNPDGGRIPMAHEDPRGRSAFGAAWLVGYAARLAGTGLRCWTAGSLSGPRGAILPDGGRTPSFAALKTLASLAGRPRIALESDAPGRVDGFAALGIDGSTVLWLANLTAEAQQVAIEGETATLGPYAFLSRVTS